MSMQSLWTSRGATLIGAALLLGACPRDGKAPETAKGVRTPAQARDEVLVQINERATKIIDFAVSGERCLEGCAGASPTTQHYSVKVRAPGIFRLELPEAQTITTYDGHQMVSINAANKTAQRIDVSDGKQGLAATLPYQVITGFLVEGWRPPLLGTTSDKIGARLEKTSEANADERVVLERALQDARPSTAMVALATVSPSAGAPSTPMAAF